MIFISNQEGLTDTSLLFSDSFRGVFENEDLIGIPSPGFGLFFLYKLLSDQIISHLVEYMLLID